MPGGHVYAVERDAAQLGYLQANAAARPTAALAIVAGEAPERWPGCPTRTAVFLGGSGGRLTDVLACVATRLRPAAGGWWRTSPRWSTCTSSGWLRAAGWERELVQLGVARGGDLAGLTHLAAADPRVRAHGLAAARASAAS